MQKIRKTLREEIRKVLCVLQYTTKKFKLYKEIYYLRIIQQRTTARSITLKQENENKRILITRYILSSKNLAATIGKTKTCGNNINIVFSPVDKDDNNTKP